jgi:two-component system cell cycle sensor histidine kinase/response regulator CckA
MTKLRILVTDDEPAVRGLLVNALAGPETEIIVAESGAQALQLAAVCGPFDLVITDLIMPSMDGLELARLLRDGAWACRFLFVSGYAAISSIDRMLEEFESAAFLAKPFPIRALLDKVASLLYEPEAAAANTTPYQPPG